MEIAALKQKIHQQIEDCDETILHRISAILNELNKEIVAYDVLGNPLTILEYNKMIDEAEEDIKQGKYISQEALEKKIDSWFNA